MHTPTAYEQTFLCVVEDGLRLCTSPTCHHAQHTTAAVHLSPSFHVYLSMTHAAT
ncbi:unnamed protein product [Ectocarpus sp. CCAP 1310/34]|nr:unnamed protein product [Ectocarpus sp. CCAP 1310/34]